MSRRYPKEFHDFMFQKIPGHTTKELVTMIKDTFGYDMTETAIKSYKTNHKIRSGTPSGIPAGLPSKVYPANIAEFIIANFKGITTEELTELLNDTFGTSYTTGQIRAYKKNRRLCSGVDTRIKPGNIPPNKGNKGYHAPGVEKSWFCKGHTPHNKLPIGSVIMKSDGYMWEKVGEGSRDWKQKHILVWEEAHGPKPDGYVITFKDGDRTNYDLDNLSLITKAESLELTRSGLRTLDKELTETGILVARLKCKVNKKASRKEGSP